MFNFFKKLFSRFSRKGYDDQSISYSQIDVTEFFDQNLTLSKNEWAKTTPITVRLKDMYGKMGLPVQNSTDEQVYQIASKLSLLRALFGNENDGVYCPICHIANIDLNKLHTPCPNCGRKLLKFGWT